jgi:hypothetical protein
MAVNDMLWSVEDRIRECSAPADRREFIECSETILQLNDQRCTIKREINLLLGSLYSEEKSYLLPKLQPAGILSAPIQRSL